MASTKTPQSQSNRKPLQPIQPRSFSSADNILKQKKQPNQKWFEISLVEDINKENAAITTPSPFSSKVKKIEPFDSSLAEELGAIRKRVERLKEEREKTERLLRERDLMLELKMEEIQRRGEVQKIVEMEIEKIVRLKELESHCLQLPAIQSLRQKEEKNTIKEAKLLEEESKEAGILEPVH